jgi:hypothetical protein
MPTQEIEVWVLVDENGDAVADVDQGTLAERYEDAIGADPSVARRVIRVVLTVPLPVTAELRGTVPAELAIGELVIG